MLYYLVIKLPESRDPMILVKALKRPGLGPIDFTLTGGQAMAVMGPSGAGKSLLLRALADLDPSEGEVSLDGDNREAIAAPEWRKRVAYIAAESGWWADDVGQHFEDPEAAAKLLAAVNLNEGALTWPISRLSTGEKQRLSLIRTLIQKPRVLLLDEPTSALDDDSRTRVEELIRSRVADGVSLVIVTHDRLQAERLGARIFNLKDGREVGS